MSDPVTAGLPAFITVKQVHAAKITDWQPGPEVGQVQLLLAAEAGSVTVSDLWIERRLNGQGPDAAVGGMFVQYPDGYTSWSPAEAFEQSATPASQWGLSLEQEPKYTVNLRGQLVNRVSGVPIPADEPVFILRGKDTIARRAVDHYQAVAEADTYNQQLASQVEQRSMAFIHFANDNPERMKEPS